MKRLLGALAPALLSLLAAPALAQDEDAAADGPQQFTCPVGGETFTQDTQFPTYPLEGYPDGGGPGVELSDIGLPECPSNGLVLMTAYRHEEGDSQEAYTPAEIARLPALIATPEYQALRKGSRAARLLWLAEQLGRPAWQRFHLLQRAAWVAKTPEERRHWMERIANEGEALAASPGFPPVFATEVRYFVINALRETGRFDEASAKLAALRADTLKHNAEVRAATPPNPDVIDYDQPDSLGGLDEMQAAIDARDDDRFPVSMMGSRWANMVCRETDDSPVPVTANTKRACAKRKADEDAEKAVVDLAFKLGEDAAQRQKLCVATPEARRSEVETKACLWALDSQKSQAERKAQEREAKRLLANPAALDQRCKAVKIGQFQTPANALAEACQQRASDLRIKETERLTTLMERNPAEYDRRCTMEYPQSTSEDPQEVACSYLQSSRLLAQSDKARAEIAKLSPAELDARCAVYEASRRTAPPDADDQTELRMACFDVQDKRDEAAWTALEADPAKLEATCARPADQLSEDLARRCSWREEERVDGLAWNLAKDHAALVASCQATPHEKRDATLSRACEAYRKCLILPVGTRIPETDMLRADFLPVGTEEENSKAFFDGRHGDGHGSYCYETIEQANAAWELVKDPAKRVIDDPPMYNGYPVVRPGAKPKARETTKALKPAVM